MRLRLTALAILVMLAAGPGWRWFRPLPADPWRASVETLLGRVERLPGGGDTAAAGAVMGELERRGDPALVDRGRVALARGLLAAGATGDALTRVGQITWADRDRRPGTAHPLAASPGRRRLAAERHPRPARYRRQRARARGWRVWRPGAVAAASQSAHAGATVRAWCERIAARAGFRAFAVADWLWTQDLDPARLARLGYAASLDGWAAFCRNELGLNVRLGGAIQARRSNEREATVAGERRALVSEEILPEPTLGGGGLGTAHLARGGLVVVRLADGCCELRPAAPRAGHTAVQLSVCWQDVPAETAIAEFNAMLLNRGLAPLELAVPAADLLVISLNAQAMGWRSLADHLAAQLGLRREGTKLLALP